MRKILLTLLICFIVSTATVSGDNSQNKYPFDKSIQVCILSQKEVQVGVEGKIIMPAKAGKQLEKIGAGKNNTIILIYPLGMDDKTIKTVLHNIINAGYYSVLSAHK